MQVLNKSSVDLDFFDFRLLAGRISSEFGELQCKKSENPMLRG